MITRRQALVLTTLPLIGLPLLEGQAQAETPESEDPPEPKGDGRAEAITYFFALDHHDPIQLGLRSDLPKAVGGALGFASFILETSKRAKVPMPPRFHAMVERLKIVQETGKPVSEYSDIAFCDEDGQKGNPEKVTCGLIAGDRPEQPLVCDNYQKGYYYVRYPEGVEVTLKWRFSKTPGGREHTVVRNYPVKQ